VSSVPVLLVAYYFPPLGGAGTQRAAAFARWLPAFGYEPVVVTGTGTAGTASAPVLDPSLRRGIGEDTAVVRVRDRGPAALGARRRIMWEARVRTDRDTWAASVATTAVETARRAGARAAVITVSPYAAAELGPLLRSDLGIPWILDLRDPWTLDGWRVHPSRLHAVRDRTRMREAIRAADLVIANTPAARRAFIDLAELPPRRVVTIPNGFEPGDVPAPPPARAPDGTFRLVHTGWLHDPRPRRLGWRRARWRDLDETGRSGRYLLEGLALLARRRPDLRERVRLELVGQVHPGHWSLARDLGVADMVVERGYLPHSESLAVLRAAELAFVPLSGVPPGEEALVVPGKLYEALAAGVPVLACLPPGDARRLAIAAGAVVCGPDRPDQITDALERLVDEWRAGASADVPRMPESFARERLTGRLARALDAVRGQGEPPEGDPWEELGATPSRA